LQAAHFVNVVRETIDEARDGGEALVCSPYDSELFGHWWFEGPDWINYLLRKIHWDQQTVKNITITGGLASCQDDCANNGGGAAENHGGILAFRRCTLMGNEASSLFFDAFGDPSQNAFGLGGAILNASGSLFLQDTTVNGNSTMGAGGGIAVTGGTALIRHSVISANTARSGPQIWSSVGAGIYVANAELSIEESSIEENVNGPDEDNNSRQFGDGGGVYVDGNSEVWIEDSAVTQNQNVPLGNGGGLFNTGTIHLLNSTVGENTTSTIGGGIFNRGTVKLRGVTVAHNTAFGIIGAHDPCEDDRTCPTGGDGRQWRHFSLPPRHTFRFSKGSPHDRRDQAVGKRLGHSAVFFSPPA